MAQEIQIVSSLTVNKGFLSLARDPGAQQIDMSGTRYDGGVQDIGFSTHEQLVFKSDFGTPGWAYFRNLDATNFVQVGVVVSATFYPLVKLFAGEACVFPLATSTIYAKADTAAVKLEYVPLER